MRFCRSGREGFLAFCPVPKILIFGLVKSRENMCPSLDEKVPGFSIILAFESGIEKPTTLHHDISLMHEALPSPMPSEPWYINLGKIGAKYVEQNLDQRWIAWYRWEIQPAPVS